MKTIFSQKSHEIPSITDIGSSVPHHNHYHGERYELHGGMISKPF